MEAPVPSAPSNTEGTTSQGTSPQQATHFPQRCSLDPDVHDELLSRWEEGFTGASIARHLRRTYPDRAPHENTVYAELKRHAADKSGAWTLADDDYGPDSARLVLEELAAVYHHSKGQRRYFTKREAWWIARLKSIHNAGAEGWSPLEPGMAFQLARLHTTAERRGEQLSPWMDIVEPGEALLHASFLTPHVFAPKEQQK
jgi:hypothetical protein